MLERSWKHEPKIESWAGRTTAGRGWVKQGKHVQSVIGCRHQVVKRTPALAGMSTQVAGSSQTPWAHVCSGLNVIPLLIGILVDPSSGYQTPTIALMTLVHMNTRQPANPSSWRLCCYPRHSSLKLSNAFWIEDSNSPVGSSRGVVLMACVGCHEAYVNLLLCLSHYEYHIHVFPPLLLMIINPSQRKRITFALAWA